MNILFLFNTDISPAAAGGATNMTHTLAQALENLYGCKVSLAFFKRHPVPSPIQNKIQITAPYNKNEFESFLAKNSINIIVVSLLSKQSARLLPDVYRSAKQYDVKVVQWFHMMPGCEMANYGSWSRFWFAVKARKHISAHFGRMVLTWFRPAIRPVATLYLRPKYRRLYDHCDCFVLLSAHFIPDFTRIAGRKPDKFHAIGNVLTLENHTPPALSQKQKEALIVSRLDEPQKRLSLALKIWQKIEREEDLQGWKLTIVGDGADMEYYQYLSRKLKLQRCTFEGRHPPLLYLKRASIFMMTSAWEGWGLTLTEAQQMGVTPIAFDSFGAVHDIIQDEYNGLLVPDNDTKAYAAQLQRLMRNDTLRHTMAQNAMESSRRFEIAKTVKKWSVIFKG
jgi:glycosyltransferase involved in cell wall biosynthesis